MCVFTWFVGSQDLFWPCLCLSVGFVNVFVSVFVCNCERGTDGYR
jgi:hypothetical protein